jgi:rubrerythrin
MPRALIKMFNEHFVKLYSNQIENGDISFFIENDYRKQHGYKEDDQVWALDKIESLRQPVKNMSEEEKKKVVKYLQNLKKLAELFNQPKIK